MRKIKFRAWDKNEKVLIGSDYDNWGYVEEEWYGQEDRMRLTSIEDMSEDNNYILMQYTGLKDKNGKGIYEGDIIKAPKDIIKDDNAGDIYFIEYYENSFVAESVKYVYSGDYPEYVGGACIDWPYEEIEVIGNIYENPELLTKK